MTLLATSVRIPKLHDVREVHFEKDPNEFFMPPLHSMVEEITTVEQVMEIVQERNLLREEVLRLKRSLQPVLDIVMDSATSDLSMELAISEAKRIYNEGVK